MSQPYSHVASAIQSVVALKLRSLTVFHSPTRITRVVRQHRPHAGEGAPTYVVTIGKPNYAERQTIKGRVAVGAPFPVSKATRFRKR